MRLKLFKSDLTPKVAILVLCLLVLAAVWTRFMDLEGRELARDEYYFINSVHHILDSGLPRFESGGYYTRGLLLQYLMALAIILFGKGTFATLLPSALFGIGTVVIAYFLGRLFLNRMWSLVLVFMLVFSSWQIEFSHFARMYASFQFFSVAFFWSLYRHHFSQDSKKKYITVGLALASIFTHQLGVFLALLLFLPLLEKFVHDWRSALKKQMPYMISSFVVLCIGLFHAAFNFRSLGVTKEFPPEYVKPESLHVMSFSTSLFGTTESVSILIMLGAAFIFAVSIILLLVLADPQQLNLSGEDYFFRGALIFAVFFAVLHQFAMAALIVLILALRRPKFLFQKPYKYMVGIISVCAVFWLLMFLSHPNWIEVVGEGGQIRSYLRSFRLAFFSWPDLYLPVFRAWADSVPVLGLLLGLGIIWQVIRIRKSPLGTIVKNPVVPILIIIILFGFRPPLYITTRYSYFLYPLGLCVFLLSVCQVKEKLRKRFDLKKTVSATAALVAVLFLFFLSEDFNFHHIFNFKSDEVRFRTGRFEKYSDHWYKRWDYKRPADFINARFSDQDKAIITCNILTVSAYLNSEFAVFCPMGHNLYPFISREQGTRELWSNNRLLSTAEDVVEYTKGTDRVWMVIHEQTDSSYLDPHLLWPKRIENKETSRPGIDQRIAVLKIDLKD